MNNHGDLPFEFLLLFLYSVIEYAKWLGMDLEKDKDLYWVAREGLMVSAFILAIRKIAKYNQNSI